MNGKRYRRALETCDWEKAERKKAGLESTGEIKANKALEEAVATWDASLVVQRLRASTLVKYRRLMKQLSSWSAEKGYIALAQITTEVLEDFRTSRNHVSANTSVKELQCFRTFFAFCISRSWCVSNPAKMIRPPKVRPNEVIPYTEEQVAAILAATYLIGRQSYERQRARGLLLIMRHTGLRISDALMLRKDQVRDGTITLFTRKTGGHILLPVPAELQGALDCLPLPFGSESDTGYYFWNGQSKMKRLVNGAERLLQAVFAKAGVPDGHAHRFRHTLATELLASGATEQDVADVLGISPGIVRRHYGKWSQARQNRIFDIMRRYQREVITCPFCNGEGRSGRVECKECRGSGKMHLAAEQQK